MKNSSIYNIFMMVICLFGSALYLIASFTDLSVYFRLQPILLVLSAAFAFAAANYFKKYCSAKLRKKSKRRKYKIKSINAIENSFYPGIRRSV